jgi:hypothetical protein
MAKLSSREELKEYCLRRLGAPVIEINVDEDQVEDRIDDAIQFWQEYHFDGVERVYLKAQVTASTLSFQDEVSALFSPDEILLGETSGARAKMHKVLSPTVAQVNRVEGIFIDGEIVTGQTSGISGALLLADAFCLGNWDTQYFDIPHFVTSVIRVLRIGMGGLNNTTNNMFDVVYQFRMNDMYNLMSTDMIYYTQVKQHLSMLDMLLAGERTFVFNRKQNRLRLDINWYTTFNPGEYAVFEAYRYLDPEEFNEVYDDMFLKRYATALIKRQWGENLKKFGGLQLPGGVILNGEVLYRESMTEIDGIEKEMQLRYELPVDFLVG